MIAFREGEIKLGIYRRHKFILILEVVPIVLFTFIVAAVTVIIISGLSDESVIFTPLIAVAALFFLHLFWIALFIVLADFYLDIWILTNERVIAVEQKGLFSRTISEFELYKIQDVTVDVEGIIPTMLNYGNLVVRTASEHRDFVFKQVWHPNMVKDAISKASFGYQQRGKQQQFNII